MGQWLWSVNCMVRSPSPKYMEVYTPFYMKISRQQISLVLTTMFKSRCMYEMFTPHAVDKNQGYAILVIICGMIYVG